MIEHSPSANKHSTQAQCTRVVAHPFTEITEERAVFDNPDTIFLVVVNHEEQYSIWPIDREIPLGWNPVGKEGNKQECLDYIEEVWTDMRPLSLRKKMDELKKQFQH